MTWEETNPVVPSVRFQTCPIRASLGVLGRKWALLILRDVAFFGEMSFTGFLRNSPGMTPRILSIRLKELQAEGLINRWVNPHDGRDIRYRLTAKGEEAVPILTAFIQFGMRRHPERVFEDGEPRSLEDVFPSHRERMLGRLAKFAQDPDGS